MTPPAEHATAWAASLTDDQLLRAQMATFGDPECLDEHIAVCAEADRRGARLPILRGN